MLTNTTALEALFRTSLHDQGLTVLGDTSVFTLTRNALSNKGMSEEDIDDALICVASNSPVGRSKTIFSSNLAQWANKKGLRTLSAEKVSAYLLRHVVHRLVFDQPLISQRSESLSEEHDVPVPNQCEERALLTGIAAAMRKRHFNSKAQALMRDVWITTPSIKGPLLAKIVRDAGYEMSDSFASRFVKNLRQDARSSFQH